MANIIKHKGTVENIDGSLYRVRIQQTSACASCSAKGYCSSSDSKEKIIEVYDSSNSYKVGEEVMIYGTTSMGMKAVLIAFVIPFVLLLVALFVAMSLSQDNEFFSALVSLCVLVPYYIVLYFLRNRFRKNFSFTLKPINNN